MLRVLVVDDSTFTRLSVCSVLREAGFETVEAGNGREGLEKAIEISPDIIMTDLLMPELDGIGFIISLKAEGICSPVYVLTADIQEAKKRQCLELGVAGFLSKPFKKHDLLQVLNMTEAPC